MSDSSQPKNSFENLTIDSKSIDDILKEINIDLSGTGINESDAIIASDIMITSAGSNYDYGTITLTPSIGAAQPVYTIGASDTITIGEFNIADFEFSKDWIDGFPNWSRVQDMCEKYPGLKIAFDNFKVFYEMVKDDYDNPTPKK